MTIKAILFDLDGVLVDAREWHYESLNRALRLFGFEISRFEHLTSLDGLPTRKKLEHLSVTKGFPKGLHEVVNDLKQNYTKEMIAVECFPVFHIEYALQNLRRRQLKLAVCTNSVRQTLDLMLTRSAINHLFDVTLSNEDVVNPKPDPEIYIKAMDAIGVSPGECLIVEDNPHGQQAAIASGAHILMVREPAEVTYSRIVEAISNNGGTE